MSSKTIIPVTSLFENVLPSQWIAPIENALQNIGISITSYYFGWDGRGLTLHCEFFILSEMKLDFPLIPGSILEFEPEGGFDGIGFNLFFSENSKIEIRNVTVQLAFSSEFLPAYQKNADGIYELKGSIEGETPEIAEKGFAIGVDFPIARLTLSGDIQIDTPTIVIPYAAMIGNTGVILDFNDEESDTPIEFLLSNSNLVSDETNPETSGEGTEHASSSLPKNFKGIRINRLAIIYQKSDLVIPPLSLHHLAIGNAGIWGEVYLGTPPLLSDAELKLSSVGLSALFGEDGEIRSKDATEVAEDNTPSLRHTVYPVKLMGMKAALQYVGIGFVQSIPEWGTMRGFVFMPFADKWVSIKATIGGPNADFMLEIGGTADVPLISLENELFEIKADSIAYKLDNGIHYAIISGSIKPKIPGFDWPELKIEDLFISSEGDISIPGGWITAPEEITLDFSAFKIGISEIGFGNEEVDDNEALKRQWLGFSGSLNLVEGLELKASVEGLKFSWLKTPNPDPSIGKDLQVSLTGIAVEFEIPKTLSFIGALSYETLTAENNGGTGLTGKLFKGNIKLNLMAIRLEIDAQLMIGKLKDADGHEFTTFFIVLGVELPAGIPLGATGTSLYGIKGLAALHAATTRTEEQNWYEWSKTEPEGVTNIDKWKPLYDEYGFGAGVTLGTAYDDGYTLNMRVMLVVLLPGPVIILEGKANLVKQRSEDQKEEGLFYLLAVLDGRAGTFMLNIDVKFSLSDVITVGASVEAFFDFHSSDNWYLHIGKDQPVEKRIRAEILSLFGANAYFMIDSRSFKTGASIGWDIKKKFGPVSFALVARMSFDAAIFWKPIQLEGSLEMYGEVALKVFGIGIELYLRMFLEGKAPRPYWIHGIAAIGIKLFWPLPDLELGVEFEWTQPEQIKPVWPLLKECSFIHHKDSSATWSLSIKTEDFSDPTLIEDITILPVDSRPVLTFARPVHNLQRHAAEDGSIAPIMSLAQDEVGGKIFKYQLNELQLEEWKDGAWIGIRNGINTGVLEEEFTISQNSFLNFRDNVEPNEPQIQLWQYSIGDREDSYQREDYNDHHPACTKRIQQKWMEVNWRGVAHNHEYDYNFDYAGLRFAGDETESDQLPTVHNELLYTHSLYIHFPESVTTVQVVISPQSSQDKTGYVISNGSRVNDMTNTASGLFYHSSSPINSIRIMGSSLIISNIVYMTEKSRISYASSGRPSHPNIEDQNTNGKLFLEPNVYYRIKTETSVLVDGRAAELTENFVYFRTDKGPGITLPGLNKDPEKQTDEEKELAAQIASYNAKTFHQFASYIDRTLPVDGAKFFYSEYDIGIQFNEAYVEKLYKEDIKMVIKDRNGKILEEPTGSFIDGFLPLLQWGVLGWLRAKEEGDCVGTDQPEITAPYLNFRTTKLFKPNSLYTVDLVTETNGYEHVMHKFQFTTSRYRNFTEHILGIDKVVVINAINLPAITLTNEVVMTDHMEVVASYDSQLKRNNNSSGSLNKYKILTEIVRLEPELTLEADKTFNELDTIANRSFSEINMLNRPSAEKFEIFKIPISQENKFILLLESPEPLAWERISVKVKESRRLRSNQKIIGFVWNEDKTRAFMYHKKGHLFDQDEYNITFTFSGDPDPITGVMLRGELIVNDIVKFRLEL